MQHVGTDNIIDENEGIPKEKRTDVCPLPEGTYSGDNILEVKRGDGIIGTRYSVDMRYNNITLTDYIDSRTGLSIERYVYITENCFYNLSTKQIDYRNKTIENNGYNTGYTLPGLNKSNTQNIPYAKNIEVYQRELFENFNNR